MSSKTGERRLFLMLPEMVPLVRFVTHLVLTLQHSKRKWSHDSIRGKTKWWPGSSQIKWWKPNTFRVNSIWRIFRRPSLNQTWKSVWNWSEITSRFRRSYACGFLLSNSAERNSIFSKCSMFIDFPKGFHLGSTLWEPFWSNRTQNEHAIVDDSEIWLVTGCVSGYHIKTS
jgi:hypothetical protein